MQKKLDVYIDFESLSGLYKLFLAPKKREKPKFLDYGLEVPYAYSIGRIDTNQVIFRYFDFNDSNQYHSIHDFVYAKLRKQLLFDIAELYNCKIFNFQNVNFFGWMPHMEQTMLNKYVKNPGEENFVVIDVFSYVFDHLETKHQFSLSKLTNCANNEFCSCQYFPKLKQLINEQFDLQKIEKWNLRHDGAIAAYTGYLLLHHTTPTIKAEYLVDINLNVLLEELKIYSEDDIKRLFYIIRNPKIVEKQIKEITIKNEAKSKYVQKRNLLKQILNLDDHISIGELKNQLTIEIEELKKQYGFE